MLNNSIIKNHLNVLGLSGSRVTIQDIKNKYKQIAEVFNPETCDVAQFKLIQESYRFLKSEYVQVKDYVNGIPVYEVELTLSDIYCNRPYRINGTEFTASTSCLKPLQNFQSCIILYKVQSNLGFKYNGLDLLYTLDIDILDAIIGVNKCITLLNGSLLEFKVPEMSLHGTIITINNEGLCNGKDIGNLYIKLNVIAATLPDHKLHALQSFIRDNIR